MHLKIKSNRAWEMVADGGGTLRIGARYLRLDQIRSYSLSAQQERDFLASLLNYTAYLVVAAMFMMFVVQAGWRERFLLVTLFVVIIGMTCLVDILQTSKIRLYRLHIVTIDGGKVDFTSADAAEVDRLARALTSAGKG